MYKRSFYVYIYIAMIAVAVTWYRVHGPHNFWGSPVAQPVPTKFGTEVVIPTYSPNPSRF